MEFKIIGIFDEKNSPRYAFGRISENNFVVVSPINEGDNTLQFELNDIVKLNTISTGPVSAINKTSNKEISIGVCALGITADEIRAKYYPMFK